MNPAPAGADRGGAEPAGAEPLEDLLRRLAALPGLRSKRDIQAPARVFPHHPFPQLGEAAALGDDAALLPAAAGRLLLACEGLHPQLVEEDPWFAGWSGVLVNLSDIAAMGGTPLAVVNSLWSRGAERAERLLAGMRCASETFAVPVVGGHTNLQSPYDALAVAVLGVAGPAVLSARAARAGDHCCLLVNPAGRFHRHYPFWDAATMADPGDLRRHLALLPQLAGSGLVRAAKDVSMGGVAGTAVMFAEAAGCRLELDLGAIEPPAGVALENWLGCFPSYGFLLAVAPPCLEALGRAVALHPELQCRPIGSFAPGPGAVTLRQGKRQGTLWQAEERLTGFGPQGENPPAG